MKNLKENVMKVVFALTATLSIISVILICVFLFANAVPTIREIGISKFLLGKTWSPFSDIYGIFPMIIGSIYVTALSALFGVPIGLLTAIFLAKFCNKKLYKILKPAVDLLAGIPSVVYGFFGLMVIVPLVREVIGGQGQSLIAASLVLGIMILPTVISVSEAAIRAVPDTYYEGSLALGATHEMSVFKTVVPAAKSGILAATVLGIGRAIGETMAVIMVAGNQAMIPKKLSQGVRTMTANIVLEMGYAADLHRDALIATAAVLFIFILIINLSVMVIKGKVVKE